MFSTEAIAGAIPALPRFIGYQPTAGESTTIVGVTEGGVLAGTATLQQRSQANGEAIHWVMRKMQRENPRPGRITAGLVVLWSDHDADPDLEWLALDVAAAAHPSATPVTVVQADTDTTRWRRPAGTWQPSTPDSLAVATAVAAGFAPPTGSRAERVAAWQHDPTLATEVQGHTDHTWTAATLETRRSIVDDVWAAILTGHTDPNTLGTVIAALAGPYWLRDTLMLRTLDQWPNVATVLAAAVRAAHDSHLPAVASVAAMAAFAAGDELSGREALIRAVTADPAHSLTALLDQAESVGMPMTSTCRGVLTSTPEHEALATGL